ncbi:unnamed protein product, partial [Brassica oleracea var. botrytis]
EGDVPTTHPITTCEEPLHGTILKHTMSKLSFVTSMKMMSLMVSFN